MQNEIFLDNNATTKPLPEVIQSMVTAMDAQFGNASSSNRSGQRGRGLLNTARENVAQLLGCDPEYLHFTSGATEANNWVIQRVVSQPGDTFITTAAEHSSIKSLGESLSARGIKVVELPIDNAGRVSPDGLSDAIDGQTKLVSVHWVNNETGTIQPVEQIMDICRDHGIPLHIDASQAVGKLLMDTEALGCDFLSFSGHKFHGPQGVGGLYVRRGFKLGSLLHGGSQEGGLRAGTENLPGITGVGTAAELRSKSLESIIERLKTLRNQFESGVLRQIPDTHINGDPANRVCNTTNLRFAGVDGEALVARLDQAGVQCSQSSACTNQRPEPSYVLRAMGLSESEAYSSVRFSVSDLNSEVEIDRAVTILADLVSQLRSFQQRVHQTA
jgi:cysteine desulfurase